MDANGCCQESLFSAGSSHSEDCRFYKKPKTCCASYDRSYGMEHDRKCPRLMPLNTKVESVATDFASVLKYLQDNLVFPMTEYTVKIEKNTPKEVCILAEFIEERLKRNPDINLKSCSVSITPEGMSLLITMGVKKPII